MWGATPLFSNNKERTLSSRMRGFLKNFARSGTPTSAASGGLQWPPNNTTDQSLYLNNAFMNIEVGPRLKVRAFEKNL